MRLPLSPAQRSNAHKRWRIWLPLLGVSAWLAFQDQDASPPEIVGPRTPSAVNSKILPTAAGEDTDVLLAVQDRSLWQSISGKEQKSPPDLFAQRSWTPPSKPVPISKPPPPPPPMAPALPFTFLGKKLENGAWEVYLARGDFSFIVKQGSSFADVYRVEQITPPEMIITFIPLEQTQVMNIGAPQ